MQWSTYLSMVGIVQVVYKQLWHHYCPNVLHHKLFPILHCCRFQLFPHSCSFLQPNEDDHWYRSLIIIGASEKIKGNTAAYNLFTFNHFSSTVDSSSVYESTRSSGCLTVGNQGLIPKTVKTNAICSLVISKERVVHNSIYTNAYYITNLCVKNCTKTLQDSEWPCMCMVWNWYIPVAGNPSWRHTTKASL